MRKNPHDSAHLCSLSGQALIVYYIYNYIIKERENYGISAIHMLSSGVFIVEHVLGDTVRNTTSPSGRCLYAHAEIAEMGRF